MFGIFVHLTCIIIIYRGTVYLIFFNYAPKVRYIIS